MWHPAPMADGKPDDGPSLEMPSFSLRAGRRRRPRTTRPRTPGPEPTPEPVAPEPVPSPRPSPSRPVPRRAAREARAPHGLDHRPARGGARPVSWSAAWRSSSPGSPQPAAAPCAARRRAAAQPGCRSCSSGSSSWRTPERCLLRLFGVADAGSTSLLAVGVLAVLVMVFLLGSLDEWWALVAVPVTSLRRLRAARGGSPRSSSATTSRPARGAVRRPLTGTSSGFR